MTEPTSTPDRDNKPAPEGPQRPLLKLALEIGPLIVFFVSNSRWDIFTATAAFMVAIAIALPISWKIARRLPIMPMVTGVFVLIFGGLTLYLQDETFIKLKPTIVNLLFAAILFGGLFFRTSLLKPLFGPVFQLSEDGWRILTLRWAFFFIALAILNEAVWRTQTTEFWIQFKLMGVMPLTLVFSMLQLRLISRYPPESDAA